MICAPSILQGSQEKEYTHHLGVRAAPVGQEGQARGLQEEEGGEEVEGVGVGVAEAAEDQAFGQPILVF